MPKQEHNCTVWLIQCSNAGDYYFMIYTAHFFALILPRKVQYMPNQAHNCTVWLIQCSYAVDYYSMNYTAHFFTLILPRKVQYTG